MKNRLATLTLLALFVSVLTGCGKEPTAPSGAADTPPAVPPAASMNFDLGFFEQHGAAQLVAAHPNGVDASAAKSNWINAVVRVVYLNLTVASTFAPPALALGAALHSEPVLGDDGWFTWTYAFNDKGHDVTLRLRGRIEGATVLWRMQVTDPQASPPMQDFLWFSGETRLQNDRGFWVFNDRRAGDPVAVARIDWINASVRDRSLTFGNVDAASPDHGDQLHYRVADALASITFRDESAQTDYDITWNDLDGTGSLRVPDYNDGERACWDEQQEDCVCPAEGA